MIDQEQVLEILHAIGEKDHRRKNYISPSSTTSSATATTGSIWPAASPRLKKRPMMEGKDIGTMLKTAGMALVSTVGGASGPLYGTAFMQAGKALAGKTELDAQDLLTILDAFVAGVQQRGRNPRGKKKKTRPHPPPRKAALDAGKGAKDALADAVAAAEQGVEYTKTIIATKGRASYLGERSLGHQDPGATSFTTMLKVAAAHV